MKISSSDTAYGIGIDTGGTYTDAVLFDLREHQVISVSKRPTLHHCLELSIVQALDDIFPIGRAEAVRKIAFSTTLATNAIAEGRMSKVGLIVIGRVKPFEAPVFSVRYVKGGHDHLGKEVSPLNVEQIVDAVDGFKGHVDAYAIAASLSIENQTHEQVAAKAIELMDRKPIVCSSVVSSKAGIRERAATAALHASLMPVIQGFVNHLNQLQKDRFLTADMRIIRGDATADNLTQAVARAASTVASGPAATAYFGAKSTAAKLAMVVDIGGTTTDITIIKNGKPVISNEGSLIDRWQTHIDAVDMHTVGIGGDSTVLEATQRKIADAILAYAFTKQTGKSMGAFSPINQGGQLFSCRFKLEVPIVGIGAAARHLLPEVANRLHTEAIFPSHFEVGNALGAIMIAQNGEKEK
jgi:N-methylhydantoinase A/oxoprolinase/acetone carboxylase beta subunit